MMKDPMPRSTRGADLGARGIALVLGAMLAACGGASPREAPTTSEPIPSAGSETTRVPATDATDAGVNASTSSAEGPEVSEEPRDVAAPALAEHGLLAGRFVVTLPSEITLADDDVLGHGARWRAWYDGYAVALDGCRLAVVLVSDGRTRPGGPVPDAPTMHTVPSAHGLEIVAVEHRDPDALGDPLAGPGAVVFEADGTATDVYVAPRLPAGMEPIVPEDDATSWGAAQRSDPRQARCFAVADAFLLQLLGALAPRRAYASPEAIVAFGWDEDAGAAIEHRSTLPTGWVVTHGVSYEGGFVRVHRRLTWSWERPREPGPPSATISSFPGGEMDSEFMGHPAPRIVERAQLFGLTLGFDTYGCASHVMESIGTTDSVCLQGSAAERRELLRVLATFTRLERPGATGP
jgi:hypothetical protein